MTPVKRRFKRSTCSDRKHDLSFRVKPYAFQHEMSLARVGEGQDCTDTCPQRSTIDEAGDLRQILACDVDQKKRGFNAMTLRKMLTGRDPPKSACRLDET